MKKIWLLIFTLLTGGFLFVTVSATQTHATEGQFLLRNTVGGQARCLAYSVELESEFHMVVNCRGLIYPPQPPEFDRYILWADGGEVRGDPIKLADLLRGQTIAELKTRFNRLFVTIENGSPRRPSGPIVMQGFAQPYDFQLVEEPGAIQSSPTPVISTGSDENNVATPTEAEQRRSFWQTTFGKIIIIITAGFLIFIFIVLVYSRRV